MAEKEDKVANPYFKFKDFTVFHDKCGMKVGTDGVLLGAWADIIDCKEILDIGTGSGLITLMLAQRSNAQITGIEINKQAYQQTQENIEHSPWDRRIRLFHADFSKWETNLKFDLIVSNPPYFEHSLQSHKHARNQARHTDSLSFEDLITRAASLLTPQGKLALILPFEIKNKIINIASSENLYLSKETHIHPQVNQAAKRILLEFSHKKNNPIINKLIIELSRHEYSEEYIKLTRDFYLKM